MHSQNNCKINVRWFVRSSASRLGAGVGRRTAAPSQARRENPLVCRTPCWQGSTSMITQRFSFIQGAFPTLCRENLLHWMRKGGNVWKPNSVMSNHSPTRTPVKTNIVPDYDVHMMLCLLMILLLTRHSEDHPEMWDVWLASYTLHLNLNQPPPLPPLLLGHLCLSLFLSKMALFKCTGQCI